MAPQQQRTTAFLFLPCLLVLLFSPLSSSQFSCTTELEACSVDEECYACLASWPVGELATCSEYYTTDSSTDAGEPMFDPEVGSCEETGIQTCCGFEPGTAESCMENALLDAYWSCNLEEAGCTVDDMPCSRAAVAAKAEADAAEEAEAGATADSSAPESRRYGAGAFAAVVVAVLAAGL